MPVLSLCCSLGNSEFVPGTQLQSKECQCRAGVPPKAKAKGVAAQAKAEAAAAGKAKARAKTMDKGGRALPEGALGPPGPCRWVRAGCLPRFRCQQRVRGSQRSRR